MKDDTKLSISGSPEIREGFTFIPGTTQEVFLPGAAGQKRLADKYGAILESEDVVTALLRAEGGKLSDYHTNTLNQVSLRCASLLKEREGRRLIELGHKRKFRGL